MPIKPEDPNRRTWASAEDGDSPTLSEQAAQAESERIAQWSKEGPGRHESQKDSSFGFRGRK